MTEEHTFRRAGSADAAAVRDLTRAAYARWVPLMGIEPRPMVADYDRAVIEHRIDLIEESGTLVALIETEARPDDLLIVNVAVAPEHQGRGLARRLLDHAEAVAAEAGRGTIRLYTNAKMTGNAALYERFGYRTEFEDINERGRIIHMVKSRVPDDA